MAGNPFRGRDEAVGFGIETTPGTGVAPQAFQPHLALTLDPKTNVEEDKSAMGRSESRSDSAVTEEWVEGSLNAILNDLTIGYPLVNILGQVAPTLHSGETLVYDNLFTVAGPGVLPPSLTFARTSPVRSRRFSMGTLTDLEIDVKQNGWVEYTATITAKSGATSTETVLIPTFNKFTSKHVVVKRATNLAGLTGATAMQLKSIKLKLSRKTDRFTPLGTIDPVSFDPNDFSATGSMVLRYTDTSLEDVAFLNTAQAVSIALINTDVTIGTATNPSLTFTMPKVRFSPITLDNPLDKTLSETVNFECELDTTANYMIQAVLTNLKNGYAHA